MSEMQERVTDAILGAFEHIPDKDYRRVIAGCWARAALEMLRDPTDEMADAVGGHWGPALESDYKAMIKAAL